MALLTTRDKQQIILHVVPFLLVFGFFASVWQGNPVSITILVVLVLIAGLVIWFRIARKRKARAAREARVAEALAKFAEPKTPSGGAAAAIEKINRLREPKPEPVTVNFQIPVLSDDTVDSLTVRVLEYYAERGGSIPIAEAKAMATRALASQDG